MIDDRIELQGLDDLRSGARILVAVSGGADSVALLRLLLEQAAAYRLHIEAAHFEHGIRGKASLEDQAFVENLTKSFGIPLHLGGADIPALSRDNRQGVEQAARNARYDFLEKTRAAIGADWIALAHHRDDQAETVLMHLLRGSGLRGACGMSVFSKAHLWRPLLNTPKEALIGYLRSHGFDWREDDTNSIADTPRNALRLEIMPRLQQIYPGAKDALARFAATVQLDNAYLYLQTRAFLKSTARKLPIGWVITPFEGDKAINARSQREQTGLDHESVLRIVSLQGVPHAEFDLSDRWRVRKADHSLYLIRSGPKDFECPLPFEGTVCIDEIGTLVIEDSPPVPDRDPFSQVLDREALQGCTVRTRQPGDHIVPYGMTGRQKLSDYFINRKIDRPMRSVTPLIAKGHDILWVCGVGISQHAAVSPGRNAVRITYTPYVKGWVDNDT
ncbi:MAG: tRNA lysidine(34) synthetase TilS [Clostridia bacterium]|nr:tRNA lysidine(34) synthetase TilS [Clostridia bacterium]